MSSGLSRALGTTDNDSKAIMIQTAGVAEGNSTLNDRATTATEQPGGDTSGGYGLMWRDVQADYSSDENDE